MAILDAACPQASSSNFFSEATLHRECAPRPLLSEAISSCKGNWQVLDMTGKITHLIKIMDRENRKKTFKTLLPAY